jgi:hypothetical protein
MEHSNKAADRSGPIDTSWTLTFSLGPDPADPLKKRLVVTSVPEHPTFARNGSVDLKLENQMGVDVIMGIIPFGRGHLDPMDPGNIDLANLSPAYSWISNGAIDSGITPITDKRSFKVSFTVKNVAVGPTEPQKRFHYTCFVVGPAKVGSLGRPHSGLSTADGWAIDPHVIIN